MAHSTDIFLKKVNILFTDLMRVPRLENFSGYEPACSNDLENRSLVIIFFVPYLTNIFRSRFDWHFHDCRQHTVE